MPELDYSAYTDDTPKESQLSKLAELVQRQYDAEQAVEKANEKLQEANDALRQVSEQDIPNLMDEIGVTSFTTSSGITVAVDEKMRMSIPKANKNAAIQWFEENGAAALIKRRFIISFGKSEEKWAAKFQRDLNQRKKKVDCVRENDIPIPSAKKFCTDKMAEGVDVPKKTLGIFMQRYSKIEVKKV